MDEQGYKQLPVDPMKLMSQEDVLKIWPITRTYLSRLTNLPNENKRLPSYQFGRRRLYSPQELMWYRENHRFVPKKSKSKVSR